MKRDGLTTIPVTPPDSPVRAPHFQAWRRVLRTMRECELVCAHAWHACLHVVHACIRECRLECERHVSVRAYAHAWMHACMQTCIWACQHACMREGVCACMSYMQMRVCAWHITRRASTVSASADEYLESQLCILLHFERTTGT